jgi:hypothetical protein
MVPASFYIGRDGVVLEETADAGSKADVEENIQKALKAGK